MNNLPPARVGNIVVQEANDETLIYDLTTNKAFCLNETSAKVFYACGNGQTFEDLKRKYNFNDDLINLALDELKANGLLEGEYQSAFTGVSRREVIRKVGIASMVALPVVSALVAPRAVHAGSCLNPGGIAPGGYLGSCSDNVGSTSCTPSFCVRPAPGTNECCSGGLTNAPGGCVTSGGNITCDCVCA